MRLPVARPLPLLLLLACCNGAPTATFQVRPSVEQLQVTHAAPMTVLAPEATDRQERTIVEALGDDADELLTLLEPWAAAVVESGGYPGDPRKLTRP